MQPFPNPYYYQQPQMQSYGGYQNNSYNNFQQPQMNMTSRVVNDFAEITASDIPMDGSQAMFLKKDGSEVQVRFWNANGQIVSTSYKPILEPEKEKVDNVTFDSEKFQNDVLEQLTGLFDDRFAKLEKMIKPTRAKKESVDDE